uniref:Dynein regulatory complex protein 1 n=1 Tax=Kryptolebias marmoratus TaxID=37003 RepID=A0A3Q3G924_KRYMA
KQGNEKEVVVEALTSCSFSVFAFQPHYPQKIMNLRRDLTAFVTDIQTAADAKVVQKRTQLGEAKQKREELLEKDVKSSQEKFDEIASRWLIVSQKVILPDLQEALNKQQQLCAVLIQDKKKLINELQQELKLGDDSYVKHLRKNAEEIDLMIERMEDQIQILTQAYREELAQIEVRPALDQETNDLLRASESLRWVRSMCLTLESLAERRKKVEEYEEKIHKLRFKNAHNTKVLEMENNAKEQVCPNMELNCNNASCLFIFSSGKRMHIYTFTVMTLCFRDENNLQKLKNLYTKEQKEFTRHSRKLSENYKRQIQKYEHFAVADGKTFEEMWLMTDAEAKQLAERALLIDSVICKQLLGLSWERPHLASLELSGPSRPQELAGNSDSGPERQEENFFSDTQEKVKELLCNETDFLVETKVLKLLAPLENEEQTDMKLVTLLYVSSYSAHLCLFLKLNISSTTETKLEEERTTSVGRFSITLANKWFACLQDACASSDFGKAEETRATTNSGPELINPDHVLPALKTVTCFCLSCPSYLIPASQRDSSEHEAYWESLGNVVSEEKLKLWDAAERNLKQYHAVLMEISDLTLETDRLKQRNAELRMQLQQRLSSTVRLFLLTIFL